MTEATIDELLRVEQIARTLYELGASEQGQAALATTQALTSVVPATAAQSAQVARAA